MRKYLGMWPLHLSLASRVVIATIVGNDDIGTNGQQGIKHWQAMRAVVSHYDQRDL